MDEPLDELYLKWLYAEVANPRFRSPSKTYWTLFRQLYKTEFAWWVPNDDNRAEDGKDLRGEFMNIHRIHSVDEAWIGMGCSMLEMLVALARGATFETGGYARDWFWQFLENLDLAKCTDAAYNGRVESYVEQVLNAVIWRQYGFDGQGGLFPLEAPRTDQREVEIWYQLNAYLMEHE